MLSHCKLPTSPTAAGPRGDFRLLWRVEKRKTTASLVFLTKEAVSFFLFTVYSENFSLVVFPLVLLEPFTLEDSKVAEI